MMAQPVHHQTIDRKRVKVYELRNNDWFDRGTGFCSSNLVPIQSEDGDEDARAPHVIVESEDEPDRLLLNTQTLIVWTEPSTGMDMALSFQEADGCLAIWNFITEMQQIIPPTGEDNLSDEVPVDTPPVITLPPADLGHLQEIENNMRIMSSTAGGRDALSRCILTTNYILKLTPLVEMAEEFESLSDLHHLCNIIKIILLLNDNTIFENALSDECVYGVVGALEYDPDFPSHKANHRDWLSNQGRYKEVVRITDEHIRYKIHETYRLNYLKDVVLARILDDPTFSVLNSLIFYNHVEIISHIQNNAAFLNDLFGIFTDPAESNMRKKEGVMFIQQCCATSKGLQPPMRMSLFTTLLAHGLLNVISFGLRNPEVTVRIAATEILVCMIDHDPQMMRQTIYRQIHEQQPQLTDTLVDLLHVEVDLGIKSQVCDALKVLLDFVPVQMPIEAINGQNKEALMARRTTMDPQQDVFLSHFYETSAVRLFKPLLDLEQQKVPEVDTFNEGIFGYLNEMICFFLRSHNHRCKFFIMQHNLAVRFSQLLEARVKHVQLVGIRFMRQLVSLRDDFYIRIIMEHRLLEPVLDLVKRCLPRDNLVCSAGLEFFDFFTKEDLGDLTKHLVTTYNEKLQALSCMPTFRDLVTGKYPPPGISNQQQQQPAVLGSNNHVASQQVRSNDDGAIAARLPNGSHASLMDSITMDPDEDAYWNGEDDDDELQASLDSPEDDHVNGDSSVLKQLVDYPSDEETDEASEGDDTADLELGTTGGKFVNAQDLDSANESAVMSDEEDEQSHENGVTGVNGDNSSEADDSQPLVSESSEAAEAVKASKKADTAEGEPTTPLASTGPPPERVSEKRRREEDEEDELTKMMLQNKRRNSRSSSLNSNASVVLQRIGNTAAVNGHTTADAKTANKISINITSPSLQAVGAEAGQSDE
ncbi:suppressor of mek1 [Ophiostoma piceae UAMH 11346]|uniref:Suppressor of mek1 n=1 Tax=Ophiostoma piceae (strain UAMH 11346) TaxID=1262450 RepID=S3BT07_OPHP1|nr:suppressor of mek1 [Ophiostoma piceae UAMH 11346]